MLLSLALIGRNRCLNLKMVVLNRMEASLILKKRLMAIQILVKSTIFSKKECASVRNKLGQDKMPFFAIIAIITIIYSA